MILTLQNMAYSWETISAKHKEAFSTLIKSLVQMTCSDFKIFFKLAEFAI